MQFGPSLDKRKMLGLVSGSPARLWTINTVVTLDDELTGARGNWLVTRVDFNRSRQGGHTTRLRLVPPGSIDLEPDAEV
jgi:prophage tail gpP-like protein